MYHDEIIQLEHKTDEKNDNKANRKRTYTNVPFSLSHTVIQTHTQIHTQHTLSLYKIRKSREKVDGHRRRHTHTKLASHPMMVWSALHTGNLTKGKKWGSGWNPLNLFMTQIILFDNTMKKFLCKMMLSNNSNKKKRRSRYKTWGCYGILHWTALYISMQQCAPTRSNKRKSARDIIRHVNNKK
jgi:hypothetical protein